MSVPCLGALRSVAGRSFRISCFLPEGRAHVLTLYDDEEGAHETPVENVAPKFCCMLEDLLSMYGCTCGIVDDGDTKLHVVALESPPLDNTSALIATAVAIILESVRT